MTWIYRSSALADQLDQRSLTRRDLARPGEVKRKAGIRGRPILEHRNQALAGDVFSHRLLCEVGESDAGQRRLLYQTALIECQAARHIDLHARAALFELPLVDP